MASKKTDIQPVQNPAPPAPTLSPQELEALFSNPGQTSFVYDEGQLERDKVRLIGVPHIITRVTYHSDFKFPKGYVTLHGVIAPEAWLVEAINRGWVPDITTVSEFLFRPGETVKYNDGSTGLRRQVTGMLHQAGIIDIGDVVDNASYDRGWDEWASFSQTSEENAKDGGKIAIPDITYDQNGNPLRILVRHGLRASWMEEYQTNVFYFS